MILLLKNILAQNYSSFESKVTVQDPAENFDARIYMNNVLDHQGYRFQSSFDQMKGTVYL
jgi:hypothetical protein